MNNIIKQPMLPDTIHFYHTINNDNTEVMRITRTGVWINPDLSIDDTAKAVLAALDSQIKVLVQAERESCAQQEQDCVGWFGYDTVLRLWFEANKGDDGAVPLYKARSKT